MVRSVSYRSRYDADPGPPPPPPADVQNEMYRFQGNGNQSGGGANGRRHDASSRPPRPFKFRAPPPTSERPLMTQGFAQESSAGLTFGGDGAEDKFRNLEDLTDTDETDMEVSADDDEEHVDDADDRPTKRTRINEHGDAAEIVPKWSNPDPYTALPPVDEDSRKKTNVVSLIRKARKAAASANQIESASHDDDFISFDFDDDQEIPTSMAPPDAPLGPRLGRHEVVPSTLGKRSRDEFEKAPLVTTKHGQQHYSDGRILGWWQSEADSDPAPWITNGPDLTDSAGVALHKEIIDFYDWVRPKDFEIAVRGSVLERLEQALLRLHPGGKLKAFGSYAAGLYLPTGDMDLVFLDRTFRPRALSTGLPQKPSRNFFHNTLDFITKQRIARPGSIVPVWFAKVPIIKFVENVSGLKIDLSFNNNTGVTANETFHTWREVYPAMPIITSVVKQYLMIRGLNDVAGGGLGGFSVICLVTSLIQHMPLTHPPANLGQLLVEFFNLYGKLFNRHTVAIRLDPPGYIDAATYRPFVNNKDKPDRLKIIDPNRPENNISGGTQKISLIFQCFAQAHDILQDRLLQHEKGSNVSSFLEQLVGGNFEAYDTQRDFLRDLHYRPAGQQAPAVVPPPPPPIISRHGSDQPPPPPPTSTYRAEVPVRTRSVASSDRSFQTSVPSTNGQIQSANAHPHASDSKSHGASDPMAYPQLPDPRLVDAINRFVRLRPALAERARGATTMRELAFIGGYARAQIMLQDLDAREGSFAPVDNSAAANPGEASRQTSWAARLHRTRRFRPDLSQQISQCTTKKQLAQVCGYQSAADLVSAMHRWEAEHLPKAKLQAPGRGTKSTKHQAKKPKARAE